MPIPNAQLKKLESVAIAAGLDQGTWAAYVEKCLGAPMNRNRLNGAINGRVDLSEREMRAVRQALKEVLDERVQTFTRFMQVDLAQAAVA